MPALSKLIGRRHAHTHSTHHHQNQTNLRHHQLLQHQHQHNQQQNQNQEDSGSITNSIIYTSNTTTSTTLDDENSEDPPARVCLRASGNPNANPNPPENRATLPHVSLMSVSPSSSIYSTPSPSPPPSPSPAMKKVLAKMDVVHHRVGHNNFNHNGSGAPSPPVALSPGSIVDNNSFQNLTHLDISGNSAEKLDLRSLTRLEWLCCSNNNLDILVLSGISLTYLDCSHNNLQNVSIDPLPNNLSTLRVSFNNLEELPAWTWIVPELLTIHASNNHLRQIDCKYQSALSQLPLRELYVYSNKIEFVSKDFIQRASRLKVLNLSQNLIECMPNLGKNSRLQELYLSRNQLQDSEERTALEFLYEATSLRRLYLAFNKIQQIHERCLASWKNLEELILCGNRIRSLPSKLSSLPSLRVLRVHSNQLETVPNLTKLGTLKVVDLSHNNLRKINLEDLITGGHLTYLDISCNEKLSLNLENFHSPKRPMNLVDVTHARKSRSNGNLSHDSSAFAYQPSEKDFSGQPSVWDLGFSELPDKNQILSVAQYRDVNLSHGKEALFGLFDSGDGNPAPKSLSKSIAKIYVEEKTIDESPKFSLKYTLLNALNCMFDADRNLRQQGNTQPMEGVLCLLSKSSSSNNSSQNENDDPLLQPTGTLTLNLAMIGNVRCILVEAGKKVKVLTDLSSTKLEGTPTNSEPASPGHESSQNGTDPNQSQNGTGSDNAKNQQSPKVIQDPVTISVPLTRSTEFLIIANQNVWNYVNDKELVDELDLHRHKKSVLISKRITDMAQSHSCKDSLSLILVRFKWNSMTTNGVRKNNLNVESNVSKVAIGQDNRGHHHHVHGTMSYFSHRSAGGSSDGNYSDELTNPLASVTTPDSAIDTDNRSSRSSGTDSNKSTEKRRADKRIEDEVGNMNMHGREMSSNNDDIVSIANSASPSQMSVEQFRCWEYMLEQNTRLLFKKELDSLSKATFARNQKQRKSVHFPFKQHPHQVSPATVVVNGSTNQKLLFAQNPDGTPKPSKTPGFFTLSKAKSLSHLFGGGSVNANSQIIHTPNGPMRKTSVPSHGNLSVLFRPNPAPIPHHQHHPQFVPNMAHFNGAPFAHPGMPDMGGQLRARGQIIGGPNAAYFGSAQRLIPSSHQVFYEKDEIQEMKNLDSIEHDNHRLKKYWDNKITEL